MTTDRIAIVSVAGRFPGSGADLGRFWENIANAKDCAREVPVDRWILPPERCTDPRIANPDTVYSTRGYYLDQFLPDLTDLDLDLGLVAQLDPLFHLVLDTGNRAWREARTDKIDRSRVGIVIGNICLPTDGSSDLCREILGQKVGLPPGAGTHPMNRYVAGLPAGLLARGLKLGLGSYTLDAACASSLYAIKLAADELIAGRADAMIAGGCSRPDCQYTQMGFAQLRALSVSGRCGPFDTKADGLMVGEGAGMFVLKRLTDAMRQGDRVLGVIASVGLSNDMHGNLLAPAKEGQLRAMRRAYELAEWEPTDVDMIECHATGTPVGDAIEFESLRELWGESGWVPGKCPIGSVKSTVGHLLTGAGAAALTKVLMAMRAEMLPPQANFATAAEGLRYANGPFQILTKPEKWNRRMAHEPRRAAVSGFGFGGVNAHLLLEEWTRIPSRKPHRTDAPKLVMAHQAKWKAPAEDDSPAVAGVPVAVVGLGAHFGSSANLRAFQERTLSGESGEAVPKSNGWDLANQASPPAFGIEELRLPIDRFRIPPKEIEETLPQQLLMLKVATAALDDCKAGDKPGESDAPTTGVFVGLGLDPNTTNYHLRWAVRAQERESGDQASPPLSANRTMGALGSVAASRIARTFHIGGPSHTVCSEEASAARAFELGVRALQSGELDRAIVGGVDLACDPRTVLPGKVKSPGEGAAAFVLKRLEDAERDGDRIYAIVRGVGVATSAAIARHRAERDAADSFDTATEFDAVRDVGVTGAASAGASLAKACVALWNEMQADPPRYWMRNRDDKLRRAVVTAAGTDGSHFAILLEEHPRKASDTIGKPEFAQPLGSRSEAVFLVEGNTPTDLLAGLDRLKAFASAERALPVEAIARAWFRAVPPVRLNKLAVSFVSRSPFELLEQIAYATDSLRANPGEHLPATARPALRDRVFYSPEPLGPKGKIAFVFPGSGNQFDGMGRDLSALWPDVIRKQQTENEFLRSQFSPEHFWVGKADDAPAREMMFGQVTVGALVSDIVMSLGVRCDAMIGLSLGESAGLFGIRAWRTRDRMFQRMQKSTLFVSDLAPPYDAARKHWGIKPTEDVDWVIGMVPVSADDVLSVLRPGLRAYLLIVNTPNECVIGGLREDVEKLVVVLNRSVTALTGVTLAHCEVGRAVEMPYRELHTLPVTAPPGVLIYSGAWGKIYKPTDKMCAESITAGLVGTIDVPAVIEAAYRDGVRAFIEIGPGASCVRMIDTILGDRAHVARAAHAAKQDALSQILRLVAELAVERWPVNFASLYGQESRCDGHTEKTQTRNEMVIPVGGMSNAVFAPAPAPVEVSPAPVLASTPQPVFPPSPVPALDAALIVTPRPRSMPGPISVPTPLPPPPVAVPVATPAAFSDIALSPIASTLAPSVVDTAANVQVLAMQAQEAFLRVSQRFTDTAAGIMRFQGQLIQALVDNRVSGIGYRVSDTPQVILPTPDTRRPTPDSVPRSLNYEECCAFAAGKVADALGAKFAEVDTFPTRVRLPDGPLQLVDCITLIEGEPLSMTSGRVVTEHTVHQNRWYLEAGRIPTAISVEAGQADLFLSGYLGIDFQTRGLAVYRLLDAVVSFQRGLPVLGEKVVYDIHIDEFVKQGESWIFRFWFDGTVNGEPFIRMRNGVAGFFTEAALAAGKGIVQTTLDKRRMPGLRPSNWRDLVPQRECSLSAEQVTALRTGDFATAFGPEFAGLPLAQPATIPGGMLRLVDRVPKIDPKGGRFGMGFVRAEFDIHPDDWFLTCHFVDDMVMPGTLMYECCLHTLRIYLMRMGWIGEASEVVCQPLPGVDSRLKCRGQVLASTKTVTYEVTLKEVGYGPEPFCVADALMYADGKPIVEITNMTLRMSGLSREKLEGYWASRAGMPGTGYRVSGTHGNGADTRHPTPDTRYPLYDSAKILAYSNGKPSEGFGEPYTIFDTDRVIARLPGAPFQFLDCVVDVTGEPFVMKAGAACVTEYEIPPDAWYFHENRGERMPFAVLLEIALQPCGWLAAYCGSALTSDEDLSFRNLGGKANQLRTVTPQTGLLTVSVKMTSVSRSAGMVIQHYDMKVRDSVGMVYEGTTYFGFFTKGALANQIGLKDAKLPWPTDAELTHAEKETLPDQVPFPGPMMRMVDRIDAYLPAGGPKGLGLVVGKIAVDPSFWFFKAHFYQDPVWPGSLGVESFLQLLKYAAWKRWRTVPAAGYQTVAINKPHSWVYRGQVLPTDKEVTVILEVTAVDDDNQRLTANGFLIVDGRIIYQMTDFTLE